MVKNWAFVLSLMDARQYKIQLENAIVNVCNIKNPILLRIEYMKAVNIYAEQNLYIYFSWNFLNKKRVSNVFSVDETNEALDLLLCNFSSLMVCEDVSLG